jgi:hypothetical protein
MLFCVCLCVCLVPEPQFSPLGLNFWHCRFAVHGIFHRHNPAASVIYHI